MRIEQTVAQAAPDFCTMSRDQAGGYELWTPAEEEGGGIMLRFATAAEYRRWFGYLRMSMDVLSDIGEDLYADEGGD